jgi:hypothetical protein
MNNALTIATETGMTVTYSAAVDCRVKYLGGDANGIPVVIAIDALSLSELASEARAWGIASKVRFAL